MFASKLEQVYDAFANKPIDRLSYKDYFVNTDKCSGLAPFSRVKRRIEGNPEGSYKFLFAGYRGCGKTTELVRLQQALENDFIILNFSIITKLDILNISYIELFITAMESIFQLVAGDNRIKVSDEYLRNITNWIKSKEMEEINQQFIGVSLEAGDAAKAGHPFLCQILCQIYRCGQIQLFDEGNPQNNTGAETVGTHPQLQSPYRRDQKSTEDNQQERHRDHL